MSKKITIFAAIALLANVSMNSANNITLGDEVRIPPRYLDGYYQVTATMSIDGMIDNWSIITEFPAGLSVKLIAGIEPLEGMTVPYTDRWGKQQTYEAPLQASANYGTISSEIIIPGYWDYDGDEYYESYGTVKWMPGSYDIFSMNFYVSPGFRSGDVVFGGTLTSGSDQRGAVLQGVRFHCPTHVWVGNILGDVDSNERLTVADVTALITYVLSGCGNGLNEFEIAAADVNQDGIVSIADVTLLISKVLKN